MNTKLNLVAGALMLVQTSSLIANGNGVAIVEPGEMPDNPVAVVPDVPQAYEPFTLYFVGPGDEFPDGDPTPHFVSIDLIESRILVTHRKFGPSFMGATNSLATEIQGLPGGEYIVSTFLHDNLAFSIELPPPTQKAYTLYHPGINHFFVTADDEELDIVIGNGGSLGWQAADNGFNVWPAVGPAPSTALPVCRFYSSLVNSHFYTASESECLELQENPDSGWAYEGIAFQALVPTAGACPAGTTPVWRLFNNRQHELDSNHRFVASPETYRIMIADGWAGEGVAFCSPPESL